ncbi:hypothetical protein ACF0H5_011529 [Mactra antiquata]
MFFLYFWIIVVCVPFIVQGGGCNAFTGATIRTYDSTTVVGDGLSGNEDPTSSTGMEMVLTHSDYTTSCACGIVTMWQFFGWKAGTVVFYVLDGNTVRGSYSVHIGNQSDENFFEVPMSSDLWIPISNGNRLGFFTAGIPMITYESVGSYNAGYYNTAQSEKSTGGTVAGSGTTTTDRKYAVAAYVNEAHSPQFVNAPYTTSIYTHDTGNVIYKAVVLDVDGIETLTVSKVSGNGAFTWNAATLELTYNTAVNAGTYSVSLRVTDSCTTSTTETITINVVNEGPRLLNLPASTTVLETDSGVTTLHTITYSDPSDTVTCSITNSNPTTSNFDVSSNNIRAVNPTYDFSNEQYYDLTIRCSDGTNFVYSNFVVDVVKNEPAFYNPGNGYLPASIFVDRTSSVSIYQLDFTDPEGETVTVSGTGGDDGSFTVSSTGEVSTSSVLNDEGYDLEITVRDTSGFLSGPYVLSIVTSGRPYTFNAVPQFVNLPYTKHVMEHTPIGTFLFKAGIITVTADIDYETVTSLTMDIQIDDGTDTTTDTITFTIVNVNEGVTLSIANPTLNADETTVRGTLFGDPGLSVTYVDAGDAHYYTMDCGADSKYFYLHTDQQIYFAREYDMDIGLSGNATCNITVRDEGGLYDTGLVELTINNINDHRPKFPKNNYVFFVTTTTTFFAEIANLSATDDDSNSHGSTNGLLSYNFQSADVPLTEHLFQINAAGILFVRNVTTYAENSHEFAIVAQDDQSMSGTCSVTVIFSEAPSTTTTTTERVLVFSDDYKNYIWTFLFGLIVFVGLLVIGFIIWLDPVVNAYVSFQMMRLSGWCRKTPKVREPKRNVGKLTVTVNNKQLENDPDNALPWELLAKDSDVPELNYVQASIEERKEKTDKEYKNFAGLPVFEKGKGERPESARTSVTQDSDGRPESESPKYATFMSKEETEIRSKAEDGDDDDEGEDQWGNLSDRDHVVMTPVVSYSQNDDWD